MSIDHSNFSKLPNTHGCKVAQRIAAAQTRPVRSCPLHNVLAIGFAVACMIVCEIPVVFIVDKLDLDVRKAGHFLRSYSGPAYVYRAFCGETVSRVSS